MCWRGFGFVHHSRTVFCHQVPNPNITIRNFFIAVQGLENLLLGLRIGALDDVEAALGEHQSEYAPLEPTSPATRLPPPLPPPPSSSALPPAATGRGGLASFPLAAVPGQAESDGSNSLGLVRAPHLTES
jgi:hypothetical protein